MITARADPAVVERIADAIGPCREGRSRPEMIAAIVNAVRDYGDGEPGPPPAEARRELEALAERASALSVAVQELSVRGHLEMTWEEQARGVRVDPDYLREGVDAIALVAAAAATNVPVKRGPQRGAPLDMMIRCLAAIVEDFGGWRAGVTWDNYAEAYRGRFFDVVRAALPQDKQPSNVALGKKIARALTKRTN